MKEEERSLIVGSNTTSVVINNLKPGLKYEFKVYLIDYDLPILSMVDLKCYSIFMHIGCDCMYNS